MDGVTNLMREPRDQLMRRPMDVARFSTDGAKRVETNRWRKEANGSGKMRRIVRAKRLLDGAKKPTDGEERLMDGARRSGMYS